LGQSPVFPKQKTGAGLSTISFLFPHFIQLFDSYSKRKGCRFHPYCEASIIDQSELLSHRIFLYIYLSIFKYNFTYVSKFTSSFFPNVLHGQDQDGRTYFYKRNDKTKKQIFDILGHAKATQNKSCIEKFKSDADQIDTFFCLDSKTGKRFFLLKYYKTVGLKMADHKIK